MLGRPEPFLWKPTSSSRRSAWWRSSQARNSAGVAKKVGSMGLNYVALGYSVKGPTAMEETHDAGSEARLEAIAPVLEGLPDATVASGRDGRIVFVNQLAADLFGYTRDELVGRPVNTLWPERLRARYTRNMELYFETEHPLRFSSEAWGLRSDGSEFVGEMSWGIVDTAGGPLLLAIGRDVSERRAAEARLRAVAALAGRAVAGAPPDELEREAVARLRETLPLRHAAIRSDASEGELRLELGDGEALVASFERALGEEESAFLRAIATVLGTALARLRTEERTRHEALHDPLTGLANRTLLRDRLEHALARTARDELSTGVLFIDLDDFKAVNDRFGHAAGDAVLAELAARLRVAVRPADTVARLGGDEFIVVCEGIDCDSATALGERMEEAVRRPLVVGGVAHRLSASIGIALGHEQPEALLAAADAALYRAKAAGRGRVEVTCA
jgi:diguanylate cyclase (GGDEF)-like protein/PAS domain S-box-containing protein